MNSLDVVEARRDAITHFERCLDRRVGEPAARIGFDVEPRADEIITAAEIREWLERDVEASTKSVEITRRRLERRRMRRETMLAQQRRHDAVARRLAGM